MKHTPGPWSLVDGWCAEANLFENQRLCSAAPELLEALKDMIRYLDNNGREADVSENAREVIAKAEGE